MCAIQANGKSIPFKKARLKWTFIYSVRRKRDADNLITSCKCAQDALVDAGILSGDDSEHLILEPVEIIIDKKRAPLTIADIEKIL